MSWCCLDWWHCFEITAFVVSNVLSFKISSRRKKLEQSTARLWFLSSMTRMMEKSGLKRVSSIEFHSHSHKKYVLCLLRSNDKQEHLCCFRTDLLLATESNHLWSVHLVWSSDKEWKETVVISEMVWRWQSVWTMKKGGMCWIVRNVFEETHQAIPSWKCSVF